MLLLGGAMACGLSLQDGNKGNGVRANDNGGDNERSPPPIWDLAFLPNGKQLLSGSEHGLILWDLETGKVIRLMETSARSGVWCLRCR